MPLRRARARRCGPSCAPSHDPYSGDASIVTVSTPTSRPSQQAAGASSGPADLVPLRDREAPASLPGTDLAGPVSSQAMPGSSGNRARRQPPRSRYLGTEVQRRVVEDPSVGGTTATLAEGRTKLAAGRRARPPMARRPARMRDQAPIDQRRHQLLEPAWQILLGGNTGSGYTRKGSLPGSMECARSPAEGLSRAQSIDRPSRSVAGRDPLCARPHRMAASTAGTPATGQGHRRNQGWAERVDEQPYREEHPRRGGEAQPPPPSDDCGTGPLAHPPCLRSS